MTSSASIAIGPGYAGYVGPSVRLRPHTTPVSCLAVGVDGPLTVSTSTHSVSARTVLCPARVLHRCDVTAGRMLCLFIDPLLASPILTQAKFSAWTGRIGAHHLSQDTIIDLAAATMVDWARVVAAVCPVGQIVTDDRIQKAFNAIHADPDVSAEELAQQVKLSRAHFLTLFAKHGQTSFRRYRQWVRVRLVAAGGARGHDLTRCAADAGFASSSHLSRCGSAMCGVTLSQMARMKLDLQVAA